VIGFGRRLFATLYDGFLLAFCSFSLAFALGFVGLFFDMFTPDEAFPLERLIVLSSIVLSLLYYTGMWTSSGQTIGKLMVGIKVVGKDGARLSWGRALMRYVGYLISGLLLSLGFLWIVFDPRRQGLHDKLAGSYVVDVDDDFSELGAVQFVPTDPPKRKWVWAALWLVFALLAPTALLGSLWVLGPVLSRMVINLLQNWR
jgi:uncharacterized RDD family membrane protein YckC